MASEEQKKAWSNRLVGQRFGKLTVIEDSGQRKHRSIVWRCKCDCGNEYLVSSNHLRTGRIKSCGKCEKHYDDLTGQRFGKLTALYPTTMKDGTHMYWMCQCDCGNTHEVAGNHLKRHNVLSCGCINTSVGETNIKTILDDNNIEYIEQVTFPDLKNKKSLRYDFGIIENQEIIRLIEFDGIQHFKPQTYFTHSLEETKKNDEIKNNYAIEKNIPLVRIPYQYRDKMTLDMILGKEFVINE